MTDQELEEKIFKYLSENLMLDVDTKEEYVGSLGDGNGNLYKSCHTLKLYLGEELISTTYLE